MPYHVFSDINGEKVFSVMHSEIEAYEVRCYRGTPGPSLDGFTVAARLCEGNFFHKTRFNKETFFDGSCHV